MQDQVNKENPFVKFSVRKPVTVAMLLLSILVIGYISLTRVKRDLLPSGLDPKFLGVFVPFPDANPKEVEEQIVKPVEEQLKTLSNLKRLFSNSTTRGSWFWLEFNQSTNMDVAYGELWDRLERARPYLPDEIERFFIRKFAENSEPILYFGVSFAKDETDPYYLTERFIKKALEKIKGVANIEVFGVREKNIQIVLKQDEIRRYNLNLAKFVQNLFRENFSVSGGAIYFGERKFILRSSSRFKTLDEIRNLPLGNNLLLKDVADVVYDFDEEINNIMRIDGQISAGVAIYKESEANTIEVTRAIHQALEKSFQSRPELKKSSHFIFFDQAKLIQESLDNIKNSALWGGIFAFFILLLFLRKLPITVILSLAIPLSLLFTIIAIFFLGWTLNTITMMGLMISIGMVVDNAIVITENIYRFSSSGSSPYQAALKGASQVGLAITISTSTTIVVFLPVVLMSSDSIMSFFLLRIAVPVIVALLASLFISLIFIPQAAMLTLKDIAKIKHPAHYLLVQKYQNLLVKTLKNRFNTFILILLIVFSLFIPLKNMKRSDFAEGGASDARVIVRFPSYYNIEKADATISQIARVVEQKRDLYGIEHITTETSTFRGTVEFYLSRDPDQQWYQVVWKKIRKLLGQKVRERLAKYDLIEDLKRSLPQIPDVEMRTSWRDDSTAAGTISYVLRGYDTQVLESIAGELRLQLKQIDGIISIEDDSDVGNEELHLVFDREKMSKFSISPNFASQYIAFNLRQRKLSDFHSAEKEIPVYLKSHPQQRKSISKLKDLHVFSPSGGNTLSSFTEFLFKKSPRNIRRENGKAFLELRVNIAVQDKMKLQAIVEQVFKNYNYPQGYGYETGRRFSRFASDEGDSGFALIFSVIFVFLIMGVLFESFVLPLSVLVAIPAAFTGSFWLVFLSGTVFDTMAQIGLIVLVGVVVNNAIVLIDLINQYRQEGMNREQAIIVAGINRFRPILMTSLTTIFGLLPMALGNTSFIGIPYSPLGVTMIGGLISSTFLTLFAVPVFYLYFDDLRNFWKNYRRRF